MEQNTVGQYDDDLTVGMEDTEDFLDTGFVDLFEHSSNNGSPISRLKTIVLSIDWEINDEVLTQFNDELLVLKEVWTGDQVKLVYVQALEKISKYIYQQRSDAHPNAIKLLLTFYYNLEKIVLGTELTDVEIKEILREDIKKFDQLKHQIGAVPEGKADKTEQGSESAAETVTSEQTEPHPVLFNLKACILGMDWEITERELADLGDEVSRLEQKFAGKKPQMILLQGISALGGYIELKKSDAHADAFKLLYSLYEGLEKIVVNPDFSGGEVKEILLPEVEKFENFKQIIASTITPEAIADTVIDNSQSEYDTGDVDTVSPAFADVPDEVQGFQAEEEAATLGKEPGEVDNRLDTFLSEDESVAGKTQEGLSPEAVEKIDSFFGDDIVDDALSTDSISAEDALRGVDVETDADDDSDEEALPTQGDGMLAPALADSDEDGVYGLPADTPEPEVTDDSSGVESSILDKLSEVAVPAAVTSVAALRGVDVETDADDESGEQPLPTDNEEIAPALAMEDADPERDDHLQDGTEVSEIDAHIDGFFGDDLGDERPIDFGSDSSAEEVDTAALSEITGDEATDEIETTGEILGGTDERIDTFFADPDEVEDIEPAAFDVDGIDIEEGEEEVAASEIEPAAFDVDDADIAEGEEEVVASEIEPGAFDVDDADIAEGEEEVAASEIEPAASDIDDVDIAEGEEEVEASEIEPAASDIDDVDIAEGEEEVEASEIEPAAFDVDDADIAEGEEEVAASEIEPAAFDVDDVDIEEGEEELAASEVEPAAFDADDVETEEGEVDVTAAELEPETFTVDDVTSDSEPGDVDGVSSFGSDSEEDDFFAAIDDRVEEPGEIQMELLAETDELEEQLVSAEDGIDEIEVFSADPVEDDSAELITSDYDETVEEDEVPLFAVEDALSELRAGVASLGVEINDSIIEGLLAEINRLRHRMMTRPAEKTFLQLLSTIVQHIGQHRYESSSEAHNLVLSVFDKLELTQKIDASHEQSQEILLAETCKVLLWQQKMIDRQTADKSVEILSDSITPEVADDGNKHHLANNAGAGDSDQDFSAVFEPVEDDAELRAFEKIEETQESLEHELGESFVDESRPSKDDADLEDLPAVVGDEDKVEVRGLSSLLSNIIKKEVKALKDLFRTELRALKDKLKDKE